MNDEQLLAIEWRALATGAYRLVQLVILVMILIEVKG